jgi:hypothetical protein
MGFGLHALIILPYRPEGIGRRSIPLRASRAKMRASLPRHKSYPPFTKAELELQELIPNAEDVMRGVRRRCEFRESAGSRGFRHQEAAPADLIATLVAPAFAVAPGDLVSARRGSAEIAFARQTAIYLARTKLGLSYAEAGAGFGRDRTTASHACRVVEERRENPRIDALLDCLERTIDLGKGQGSRNR